MKKIIPILLLSVYVSYAASAVQIKHTMPTKNTASESAIQAKEKNEVC